jgi:hypothetical protein
MKPFKIHLPRLFFLGALITTKCLLFSCGTNDKLAEQNPAEAKKDTNSGAAPAFEKSREADLKEIKVKVLEWDAANNSHAITLLDSLYADEVAFNGTVYSRQNAITLKKDFFANHKNYRQNLEKDINITEETNGNQTIHFTRDYTEGKVKKSVKTALVFQKFKTEWKIIAENDENGSEGSGDKKPGAMPESEITNCDKAAEAIFLSSHEVQGMLAEKYVKYSLEYRPGDKENPSKRFWFWVFAAAPNAGKTETYGRFQVDPKTGALYKYDVVNDKSDIIPSNTSLAKYLKKYCK